MSFDQLRSFVAVAETQSVTAAARRLHLTQPPVSRQIQRLEDELEQPLFARHAAGMTLLPAGERLLVHARAIMAAVDAAVVDVRASG